jgi:hypothetical protein
MIECLCLQFSRYENRSLDGIRQFAHCLTIFELDSRRLTAGVALQRENEQVCRVLGRRVPTAAPLAGMQVVRGGHKVSCECRNPAATYF